MPETAIRLIVNADDLGAGPQRDRGIFRAFREGIVSSASLLANGPSFSLAVRQAGDLALPTGVHLNLSEGPALTGPIAGLTDRAGLFFGKNAARRVLASGSFDTEGALKELATQVATVMAAGLLPDHLDTHQHFCLFPAAIRLVVETAERFGIRRLRLAQPMEPAAADPGGSLGRELEMYRALAPAAAEALRHSSLITPDGLWGMPSLDRLDATELSGLLARLPPGTWELMVHPGYADGSGPFSGRQREIELAALTSAAVRRVVAARRIELISFGELPCAS